MNIKHLNKAVLLILFIIFSCIVSAQMHFKYRAALDSIKQSGFYRIPLSASVLAKCQRDFADLRILEDDGNQAAYILQTEKGAVYTTPMIDLPIIKKEKEADKQWHITLENSQKRNIDYINLKVGHTTASRNVVFSGSDDRKNWYVINENLTIEFDKIDKPDMITLSFPPSSYKYFQITLLGKDLLPIEIEKATIFSNKIMRPSYRSEHLNYKFIQKDSSDKKSYIKVSFDEAYPIDNLHLNITGTKYFKRDLEIYGSLSDAPLFDTVISGFNIEYLEIPHSYKEKELWLIIDNKDNSPLKINSINILPFARSLTTYLDSSKKYKLCFGDSTLALPNYDITSFKDSITKTISDVAVGNIEKINYADYHPKMASNKHKWIIWLCIGVALVLLLGITIKMLKDIGGRKE